MVTDGDCKARDAVEIAASNIGARCISITGCHQPGDAYWDPEDVEELVLSTPRDPVVVLVDDEGEAGEGRGERVLRHLAQSDKIAILGVVAVASDLEAKNGAHVAASISQDGKLIATPVDKHGRPVGQAGEPIRGDTVENLDRLQIPLVIGLGDPGKMNLADDAKRGAPITTKALESILKQSAHGKIVTKTATDSADSNQDQQPRAVNSKVN